MSSTEFETKEMLLQIPELSIDEATQDPADQSVGADVRDSRVPEPSPGPGGVTEALSMEHGSDEEAPPVRTYSSREAIVRQDATGVRFVDVREAHEVTEGIVPGALHIPLDWVETAIDPHSPRWAFDDAAEIVFYCRSGRRSAIAARRATEMGVDQVAHVEGGIRGWTDAGGPVRAVRPDRLWQQWPR